MGKGFLKFKNHFVKSALVKSVLFALSCSLLFTSAWVLFMKLTAENVSFVTALLIALLSALLCGALMLAFTLPRDKRLAKKLDRELSLNEKVQTMLAFADDNSPMAELQRNDANDFLMSADPKAVKNRNWWCHILAPCLACLMLVTAIVVPARAKEAPPAKVDPPFVVTDWQKAALLELITTVEKSDMEQIPKSETVTELRRLLALLDSELTDKQMMSEVEKALFKIKDIEDAANTYNDVCAQLDKSEDKNISAFSALINALGTNELSKELEKLHSDFGSDSEYLKNLPSFSAELEKAMSQAKLAESDLLGASLNELTQTLKKTSTDLPSYTVNWAKDKVSDAFEKASDGMSRALFTQYTNKKVATSTIYSLMEIFGIKSAPEGLFKNDSSGGFDRPEDFDEEFNGDDGGLGDGEMVFAGDDEIYDPDLDDHVQYGSVLNTYQGKALEKSQGSDVSDELEKFISDYFTALYDGWEKDKEEQNS